MNNTAPKLTGLIVVAAMFGLLLVGSGVFALVFFVLALGWREPQGGPKRPTK